MSFQNGTKVGKNVCSSNVCFVVSNTIQPCISFVIVEKRIERNVVSREIYCVK